MRILFIIMLLLFSACQSESLISEKKKPNPAQKTNQDSAIRSPLEELTRMVEGASEPKAAARWNEIRADEGMTTEQKQNFAKWVLSSRRPEEKLFDAMSRVVLEHPEELTSTAKPSAATKAMSIGEYIAHKLEAASTQSYDFLVFQPNGVGLFHQGKLKGVFDKHPKMPQVIQALIDKSPPGFKVEKLKGKTGKYGFAAKVTPEPQ